MDDAFVEAGSKTEELFLFFLPDNHFSRKALDQVEQNEAEKRKHFCVTGISFSSLIASQNRPKMPGLS